MVAYHMHGMHRDAARRAAEAANQLSGVHGLLQLPVAVHLRRGPLPWGGRASRGRDLCRQSHQSDRRTRADVR
jgi:hypothetical protein